jgi:membrane protease YdiL (CAAX protease family)
MGKNLFLLLAGLFPSVSVFSYMVLAEDATTVPAAYAASKLIQLALPFVWIYAFHQKLLPTLWKWNRRDALEGTVGGLLIFVSLWAFYYGYLQHLPLVQAARPLIEAKVGSFNAATPERFLALCLFISVVHSLFEEFYWRAFLHGELEQRMGFPWAVVLSSAGFMGHHIVVISQYVDINESPFWAAVLSLLVAAGGAVWAWQYRRRQSLWGIWISHFLADVAILSLGFLLLF